MKSIHLKSRLKYDQETGEWPKQIDHKDGRRGNGKWNNLRNATHSQNQMNSSVQVNNNTGYKGVSYNSTRDKYQAQIKKDGKPYFLGYFDIPEEAYKAYVEAARQLHGEYANV